MKFSIRLDDIEVRSCDSHLLIEQDPHTTAAIVKWDGEYCYSLAYWVDDDLRFVGDRPFSEDSYRFWKLAQIGQRVLYTLKELEVDND